jgi:hypothetical protein
LFVVILFVDCCLIFVYLCDIRDIPIPPSEFVWLAAALNNQMSLDRPGGGFEARVVVHCPCLVPAKPDTSSWLALSQGFRGEKWVEG